MAIVSFLRVLTYNASERPVCVCVCVRAWSYVCSRTRVCPYLDDSRWCSDAVVGAGCMVLGLHSCVLIIAELGVCWSQKKLLQLWSSPRRERGEGGGRERGEMGRGREGAGGKTRLNKCPSPLLSFVFFFN